MRSIAPQQHASIHTRKPWGRFAGSGGLLKALRTGTLEADGGGQAVQLARVVAKHGIKARHARLPIQREAPPSFGGVRFRELDRG